jgi:6-phosphogluconolactonase (cycloisomerase 2 family)
MIVRTLIGLLLGCGVLTACGGASSSSWPQNYAQSAPGLPSRAPGSCPCLYVANRSGPDRITVYVLGARKAPIREITGSKTGLNGAWGVAVDAGGSLYVANSSANTVTVYAAGAHKNAAPIATIGGSYSGLDQPSGVAVDASGSIYVTNYGSSSVEVFTAGSSGNVAPAQTIAGSYTNLDTPTGIAVDGTGNVYVTNSLASSITVYSAGASGNVPPTAEIVGPATQLSNPSSLALDANDDIFVANPGQGPPYSIDVFSAGSNGNISPIAYISGGATKLDAPFGIALDPGGNAYVGNYGSNAVTTYASGANGDARPVSVLSGRKSKLRLPDGIAIR